METLILDGSGRNEPTIPRKQFPIGQYRDKFRTILKNNPRMFERGACSLALLTLLGQCFRVFPFGSVALMSLVAVAIAGLVVLNIQFGLVAGLAVMTMAMGVHHPLLACVFCLGAGGLMINYLVTKPGYLIALLLMPLLLKFNLAYVVPLGAAVLLGTKPALKLSVMAATASLGYMLVANTHNLGPLVLNQSVAAFALHPSPSAAQAGFAAFFSPNLVPAMERLVHSVCPFLLTPPLALIQIGGWGVAGYVAAKVYRTGTSLRLVWAMASGLAVILLQVGIVNNLSGTIPVSLWWVAANSVVSITIVSILHYWFTPASPVSSPVSNAAFVDPVKGATFQFIGGLKDVKREIEMAVQSQFDPKASRLARHYGVKTVKGILFYGPPGCGKTLFAKAIAGQFGAHFFSVSGADFRSKWYGEAEQNVKKVFADARAHPPALVFFDEIENMLGRRDETMTSDSPERRVVAQFLAEMDGIKSLGNVVVVGATNEPDLIDPAALRPGRFDKLIYIPLPDLPGREQVFRVHLDGKPLAPDVAVRRLAQLTERFSGADIADLCAKVAEQCAANSLQTGRLEEIAMAVFERQIKATKPSVSLRDIAKYEELKEKYCRRTLRAETGDHEVREVYSWDRIGGLEQVRREMVEAIETPLKRPEMYDKFKIKPPKGVLLFGPPGCGKTLMAKIVAHQCGAHFLSVDTKRETKDSIREWFIRARENRPCILFFDEIDAIGAARHTAGAAGQEVVTQLLVELDGMQDLKQVIVVAATNRPDTLDSALMRPGRFDRLIPIPPPDQASRVRILQIGMEGKPLASDVNIEDIAVRTENYSGADLAAVCYEAAMSLLRSAPGVDSAIHHAALVQALERIRPSLSAKELADFREMENRFRRG